MAQRAKYFCYQSSRTGLQGGARQAFLEGQIIESERDQFRYGSVVLKRRFAAIVKNNQHSLIQRVSAKPAAQGRGHFIAYVAAWARFRSRSKDNAKRGGRGLLGEV